jgi:hypothetical protein
MWVYVGLCGYRRLKEGQNWGKELEERRKELQNFNYNSESSAYVGSLSQLVLTLYPLYPCRQAYSVINVSLMF